MSHTVKVREIDAAVGPTGRRWLRWLPLAALGLAAAAVLATGVDQELRPAALAAYREAAVAFVAAHQAGAALAYVGAYAAAVALSIPGGVVFSMIGGFLFGTGLGTVLVVIGATAGACGVFLATRTALGPILRARAGPWVGRLARGFREDALSYLLFLRLVPLFPFWLVNVVPALLGVRLSVYCLATLAGIIPGALVFASVGSGLGVVIDTGGVPDASLIFAPEVLGPILGLALLSLVPVAVKRMARRRAGDAVPPVARDRSI